MVNDIRYYLHVYDSALRIYSQNKSEYQTTNYLYIGAEKKREKMKTNPVRHFQGGYIQNPLKLFWVLRLITCFNVAR